MINVLVTIISDHFTAARVEAKKMKQASMFDHLKKKVEKNLPMKKNRIGLYSSKLGVNYSDYVEHIDSFEVKTKKLVDKLKIQIEKEIEFSRNLESH